jgi:hypothetical protein
MNAQRWIPGLTAAMALSLLAGCVNEYPLKTSKAEWESMLPRKQAEYRQLQRLQDGYDERDAALSRRATEEHLRSIETQNARFGPMP